METAFALLSLSVIASTISGFVFLDKLTGRLELMQHHLTATELSLLDTRMRLDTAEDMIQELKDA